MIVYNNSTFYMYINFADENAFRQIISFHFWLQRVTFQNIFRNYC